MNRGITPQAIWTAGTVLLVLDASQRPYWQHIGHAITTGQAPQPSGGRPYQGLWVTGGGVVLVAILASLAAGSEGMGDLAGAFLVVLWAGWLLSHPDAISNIASLFTGPTYPDNGPAMQRGRNTYS